METEMRQKIVQALGSFMLTAGLFGGVVTAMAAQV
jgi:hypothetical protein